MASTSEELVLPDDDHEDEWVVKAHVIHWKLLTATWITHFKSLGYIKEKTMEKIDQVVCRKIVARTPHKPKLRMALGSDAKLWSDMVACMRAATASLEERSYGPMDQVSPPYDGPNSNIIVKNADSLLQDLERIDSLVAVARNIMAAGEKVQNLAAQNGFDREVCQLIHLCIKITARGYDGDGTNVEEDRWQHVVNGFKKLLITCLQFLSNLSTDNERLRLLLWVELFDSNAEHQPVTGTKDAQTSETVNTATEEWLAEAAARIADAQRLEIVPTSPFADMQQHLKHWAAGDFQGPKAAMAAYLIFVETRRDQIAQEMRDQGVTESHAVMAELQRQWKAMSEQDQEKWVSQYRDRIARYEAHIELVAAENTEGQAAAAPPPSSSTEEPIIGADASSDSLQPPTFDRPPMSRSSSYSRQQYNRQYATPPPVASPDTSSMETALEGKMKLAEGKAQLMKRLENVPQNKDKPQSLTAPNSPTQMPDVPPPPNDEHVPEAFEAAHEQENENDQDVLEEGEEEEEDEEEEEEEEDYDDEEDSEEEEDEESSEDEYAIPGEDGRGLLTDVPLILGPNEIEVLPMIIMSGLVAKEDETQYPAKRSADGKPTMNMYTIRCHLLLAQENGRNLLRELLIFVAAWDLREEELYFKFMFKITEAILMNGLMPFAYSAFKESKDIISPAQAVIMKLLTKIFHSRASYISIPRFSTPRVGGDKDSGEPVRHDIAIVRYLFAEFRQNIIPQICSLIFLQGQIRRGKAAVEDFPLNLWDMERMYEGVYQYLEFFAILTDHEEWKRHMAKWEVVSELVTLLRELEMAIPKSRIITPPPPPPPQHPQASARSLDQSDPSAQSELGADEKPTPAPVSVERPFDVDAPVAAQNADAANAQDPSTTPYPSPPLHDEPADFEWRNLKKLCVLVLSSLVWKNRALQDQVREHKGITALLACCAEADEHNPYVVEHAIMCLRFALEGNEVNADIVRDIAEREHYLADRDNPNAAEIWEEYADTGPYDPELGELHVPPEVLDHHGYETYMDIKGQVGLRRKDETQASSHPSALQPANASYSPSPSNSQSQAPTPVLPPFPEGSPASALAANLNGLNLNGVSAGGKKTGLLEAIGGLPDLWMGLSAMGNRPPGTPGPGSNSRT